jgi:hypothetical protein
MDCIVDGFPWSLRSTIVITSHSFHSKVVLNEFKHLPSILDQTFILYSHFGVKK